MCILTKTFTGGITVQIVKKPLKKIRGIGLYTNRQIVIVVNDALSHADQDVVIDKLITLVNNDKTMIHSV